MARGPKKPPIEKKPKVSRARTPPCEAHPSWTVAKYWSFIRSALRSAASKWPPKFDVLKMAKKPYEGQSKQQKWQYKCAECDKWYKGADVSVDHIVPAGSLNNYDDLPGFVQRLFVGPEGLQVLCSVCHSAKTKAERGEKKNV